MKDKILIVLLATVLPGLAAAQDAEKFQCSYADMQRRVEIYHEPGVDVPCEVHYYKDSEMPGERQVLWSAQSESGYCERKASEFIAKLEGWGWDCGQGAVAATEDMTDAPDAPDATEAPDAEEPADDTDVLAPAAEAE
ncbi:MAG: hypothetical protein IIA78_03780 [Proteobacteria bacterium]|nr:hypothetical protein [Pseudomonadota bacterium]